MIISELPKSTNHVTQKSQVHDCTHFSLRGREGGGEKKKKTKHPSCLQKLHHSWETCCRKYTVWANGKMTRKTGGKNTSHGVNVNHCTSSYRWGGKTQDEHKKPFKNTSPEKGRPVLNTVQKRLEPSSILLSSKIRPQIIFNNKVTQQQQQQQHWKMDVSLEK